jgi:tetratricopeptide (TPR) repeat protein
VRQRPLAVGLVVAITLGDAPTAAAAPDDDATQMFDRAEQLYRDGRYHDAIELLRALQLEHPDPLLDYNIGRAHESAGEAEAAIDAYQRYLDATKDAIDRADVEARIARLRASIVPAPASPPSEPVTPIVVAPPKPIVAPWVLAGLGGVGLGVGAALGGVARSRRSDAVREPIHAEAAARIDEARRFALAANITFAIAGAVVSAGLAWGIARVVRRRHRARSDSSAARRAHADVGSPNVVSSIE